MVPEYSKIPEIESFNLADLNISGLDVRLELTTVLPQIIICTDCSTNCSCYNVDGCGVFCGGNTGCACDAHA